MQRPVHDRHSFYVKVLLAAICPHRPFVCTRAGSASTERVVITISSVSIFNSLANTHGRLQ